MTWQFIFEHAYKIIGLSTLLLSVIISPFVIVRWLRTRNELLEIQTFIKKNEVVREEVAEINNMLSGAFERIRTLEQHIIELDKKLHEYQMKDLVQQKEIDDLIQIKADLEIKLANATR